MKTCPHCAEEIQDAAIVCKHCGRELDPVAVEAVSTKHSAPTSSQLGYPFYVSLSHAGHTGLEYWPLPSVDSPGAEYDGRMQDGVALYTLTGLLFWGRGFDETLFRAEFDEKQIVPTSGSMVKYYQRRLRQKSAAYREFFMQERERSVRVRRARLAYEVKTYRWSLMRRFARDCAERALDAVKANSEQTHGRTPNQDYQRRALRLARKAAADYEEFESWWDLEGREVPELGLAGEFGTYALDHSGKNSAGQMGMFTKEIEDLERIAWAKADEEVAAHRPAAMSARACLTIVNNHAANEAAKHARDTASAIAFKWGEILGASEEEKSENQEEMDRAWIAELQWQASHLAEMLGDY